MICDKCNGTGDVPLPPHLKEALDIVTSSYPKFDGVDASFVRRHTRGEVKESAMCNRLKRLLVLGLVSRFRSGKSWIYSANRKPRKNKEVK